MRDSGAYVVLWLYILNLGIRAAGLSLLAILLSA